MLITVRLIATTIVCIVILTHFRFKYALPYRRKGYFLKVNPQSNGKQSQQLCVVQILVCLEMSGEHAVFVRRALVELSYQKDHHL